MVVSHHRSLKTLPSANITNNSDDEDNDYKFDFTSFPTIADPEQNKGQTLSHMITSTLRKVTNNASNLVHNYSKVSHDDRTNDSIQQTYGEDDENVMNRNLETNNNNSIAVSSGGNESERIESVSAVRSHIPMIKSGLTSNKKSVSFPVGLQRTSNLIANSNGEGTLLLGDLGSSPELSSAPDTVLRSGLGLGAATNLTISGSTAGSVSGNETMAKENPGKSIPQELQGLPIPSSSNSNSDDLKSLRSFISTTSINTDRAATESPPQSSTATPTPPPSNQGQHGARPYITPRITPRVHSNSKTLSLSTLSIPRLQPTSSTTDTLININASGVSEAIRPSSSTSSSAPPKVNKQIRGNESASAGPQPKQAKALNPKIDSQDSLQNRISSIFNNLPNDIELSDDDSTSETETINNQSFLISPQRQNSKKQSPKNRKGTSSNHNNSTPSGSATHPAKKNSHGHLSSVIFDNAKSLINNGINNVVSSSSNSIISGRKEKRQKKKKPKKASDNPLKNGGIPRFYWMNDSFVSDCLNCFKPFTAFRRKHHCRFCGQIFCNDCTLFISYSQHKEERKKEKSGAAMPSNTAKRNYPDKLRVCKPCYSDVIVYLSDDSSSSDENSDSEDVKTDTSYVKSSTPVGQTIPEIEGGNFEDSNLVHPLSRIRSRSTNSRRNSMIVENAYNKGFLASGVPSEFSDTWSPSKQKRLPNSNGNNGIPMTPEVANGKTLPGQGLLMAIPTTRKGESVEIPMPIGSYSSTILGGAQSTTSLTGGNVNGNLLATPTNISTTVNSKAWLKNYTYNRNNPAQNQVANNKGNNLDNLSHIYSNFIKKKSNTKLHEADDQNHKGDEGSYDSDKSSDEPDVESDNEDEQVMSLYTSLNHHNGGVTVPTVPTLSNTGIIGSSSSLTSRVTSGQYQTLNPNSNGMPMNVVVPTLGEFPLMASGNENRFPRRQMFQSGKVNLSTSGGNHNETSNDTLVLSKLFQSSQSTENKKSDILSGEGKSISFIEDRPKSDIRSHERAHASLLRMRSRRKSKSVRTVLLLTHQNNSNNNSSFSNSNFNTSGSGRLPKIDTSFNAYFASNSPSSTPISPTPNFNSSTSLSQQKSNEGANTNNSLNLFSPAQVLLLLVIKRTGSAEDMMPVTPILSHASRTSGDFENDMILDDSIYKFEPLRDEEEGERNDIDGFITTGDFNSSVVHFESPYKSNESIYEEFLNNIFIQYLNDSGMKENQDRWSATVSKLFCSVDKIKITDTLDTKQYIKIRRLLGGKIEDSKIVDGIFWTKNIDSKKMLSSIENPKIALLMFPIEYLKQKEQFISLRIVHSQQDVYVTNLVSRLISLEPDVIVVGDTVCGLAEQLLEEAGITVISNTKPQVIERISRYTKTDIFQSVNDLFFKKGSLGTCKKLEVKKYLYQNIIKSFVFFTGNDISSGFTMALRGGDAPTLRVVKNATESTIPVRLNAKFEKGLFEDHYLIFRDFGYHTEQIVQTLSDLKSIKELLEENPENSKITLDDVEKEDHNSELSSDDEDPSPEPESIAESTKVIVLYAPLEKDLSELLNYNTEISRFVSQFDERIIASSPAVKLLLPASLTNLVESYKMLAIFYYKYKQIQNAQSVNELTNPKLIEDQFFNIHIDIEKLPYKETDLLKILKYRSSIYLRTLRTNFQSRWRLWSNNMNSITLDPQKRNNIYVLNSTVSIKYATPCYGPVLVVTDNYTENDLCLGLFLDKIFTEASKVCSECGDTYMNHYRTYSHGNGKLDMILEQIQDNITANVYRHDHTPLSSSNPADSPSGDSKRYMWSYCTICNSATPVVAMSDETFYLSIGKFFELCFWGTGVIINSHECGHDFFKHHVRYFGYKDLAIKMVYSPIDTYEVIVPKKQLEYLPDIDIQLKIDSLDLIRKKSSSFFSSISNRLNRVKIDAADKIDDGLRKIEELKALLDEQVEQIEKRTLDIYNSTLPSIHLPMNSVLRDLQELGVVWDNEFVEFEKDFLPSENEIARITQFHLRKYLIDLRNEVKKEESGEQKEVNAKEENEINEKSSTKVQEIADEAELSKDTDSQTKTLENDPEIKSDSKTSMPKPSEEESSTSNATRSSPELRKQISKMIPSSLLTVNNPLPSVMEKIHKMEALLEYERKDCSVQSPTKMQPTVSRQQSSLAPKSPLKKIALSNKLSETSLITNNSKDTQNPASSMNPPNKVHNLANFFDQLHFEQISAEFKKQRERELQKKMNRYKAFPVVASKPIVEIYNKIEDAVDVEDKRDASESRRPREKGLSGEDTSNTNESNKGTTSLNGKYNLADENDPSAANTQSNKAPSSDIPQPEKNSLLKNLSSFWADRSATLWEPLEYPLGSSEHTFADSDVIVREDEPSSLIAFCLSSTDYKQKLQSMSEYDQNQKSGGATGTNGAGGVTVISNAINSKKAAQFANIEKKFKKNNSSVPGELEDIMNRFSTTHLKYQYLDGQTALSCKIFYSEQFEAFRKACGNEDSFIQSLSRCVKWDSSGGKSGSSFLKTLDNRYIVKELSKQELESFVAIAPFYFKYMSQSMFNTLTTAIAKIFGFYQIHIRNPTTGKNFKMDFLIMENLFYNKKTTRIFDLKGSMRNRHVQQTGKENEVLLDENMIEYIYESPVFVRDHSKKLLRGSLFNDTAFLSAMDVMDYSLVIGIVDENDEHGKSDPNKKQLYVGIIDCIRTFTWDKKVENWVKGTNLIGGKKGKDPTIVTPKQYRTRFREAMERYILEVPDCWYNF